jgi:hypothetical protein
MRKILLSLVAMLCAVMTINAQDLYLRGDINGWGTSDKFTNNGDGTYTLNLASLSGNFKVADSTWSTYNYGSNGTKLELGVPYVCTAGSNNNISLADGQAANVTLSFELSTGTLTITGQQAANEYDTVYLIGGYAGAWDGTRTDMPLTLVSGTSTPTYKGTYTFSEADTFYFKLLAGTWYYGPGEDVYEDVAAAVGFDSDIYYPAGDKSYTLEAGTYTFTVTMEKDAATAHMTIEGSVVLPSSLYLIGDFNYEGDPVHWDDGIGIELTSTAEGVYSAKDVELIYGADMAPSAYFSFCTRLDGTGSWNLGTRYGATEADTAIAAGDTLALVSAGDPYAYAAAPGVYDVTVDLNNMKVTLAYGAGVSAIANADDALVNVYNFQGVQILKSVKASEAANALPAGLYIIGGKKVVVK